MPTQSAVSNRRWKIDIVGSSIQGFTMSSPTVWLILILIIGSGAAADVPFVFDSTSSGVAGYSADQLEQARISSPDLTGVPAVTTPSDNEVLQFPVTGGGSTPGSTTEKNAGDLKKALDARVEPDNSRVRDEAVVLALKYPGEKTIEQIASIYNYLKNGDGSKKGWGYVSDPRGIDYFMFANQTLKNGDRANCVGGGDCDDFAILMSALIESVGGTTRIILARNSSIGGHAYTEVYLGNLSEQNNQVEDIIDWLKEKFDTDKIYTHIDTDSKDVWLNLDWGPDEKGNTHPGGPFFQGDKHIVLCIRDGFVKTQLSIPENYNEQISFRQNPAADWIKKGDEYYNQSKYGEALQAYEDAIQIDSKNSAAWNGKCLAFMTQGKYDEAIQCLDKSFEIDSQNSDTLAAKGFVLYTQGKYEEALQDYERATQIDSKNSAAWNGKCFAFMRQGEYDEAIRCLDKSFEINYLCAETWTIKGSILNLQGENDEALMACDKAIEIDPKLPDAWNGKANILSNQGKYDEAIRCLDKSFEINYLCADTWTAKGFILNLQGKYDEALMAWERAIEINPKCPDAWNGKAELLTNKGKFDEAIVCVDKSLEINPQYADTLIFKGYIFYSQEEYEDAQEAFDRAIEINPKSAGAWNGKGFVLVKQSKFEEATIYLDKAIEINPKIADSWVGKAYVFDQQGEYEIAIKYLDKAIEINPNEANAWNYKGYDLRALGRNTEADAAFAKAKELGFRE